VNYNTGLFKFTEVLNTTYEYAWSNELPFNKLGMEFFGGYLIQLLNRVNPFLCSYSRNHMNFIKPEALSPI
jgi:hypothetical protein